MTTPGARYRKKRRDGGKCGYEGCPILSGEDFYYCAEHRLLFAAKARARRKRQKESRAN